MKLIFVIKRFEELSTVELYKILRLRAEIFIVEQNCVYQDIDDKDQKGLHVIGYKNNEIVAYTRLFDANQYFENPSIGRVVVSKYERNHGYGHILIKTSIDAIETHYNNARIQISAQKQLKKFYQTHGFIQIGKEYIEDGIPHISMIRTKIKK